MRIGRYVMNVTKLDIPVGVGLRAGCGCLSAVVVFFSVSAALAALAEGVGTRETLLTLGLFVALPLAILVLLWVLIVRDARTWIEGSVLVRRIAFRSRRIDLATVDSVRLDYVPDLRLGRGEAQVPVLVIRDAATGTIRLPLKTKRGWLPSEQLHALASGLAEARRYDDIVQLLRELARRGMC